MKAKLDITMNTSSGGRSRNRKKTMRREGDIPAVNDVSNRDEMPERAHTSDNKVNGDKGDSNKKTDITDNKVNRDKGDANKKTDITDNKVNRDKDDANKKTDITDNKVNRDKGDANKKTDITDNKVRDKGDANKKTDITDNKVNRDKGDANKKTDITHNKVNRDKGDANKKTDITHNKVNRDKADANKETDINLNQPMQCDENLPVRTLRKRSNYYVAEEEMKHRKDKENKTRKMAEEGEEMAEEVEVAEEVEGVREVTYWKDQKSKKRKDNGDENENLCSICKELGKSSVWISYCIECKENLCEMCKNIHLVSKLSKHHNVIARQDTLEGGAYSNKIFKLLSKYTHCPEHPEDVLEFYCQNDNVFLCVTCYLSHIKHCEHVLEIKQISAHQKSSRLNIGNLVDDSLNLSQFAKKINDTLKRKTAAEKDESAAVNARLAEIRTTVEKLLDSLENSVKSQHRTLLKHNRKQRLELAHQLCETRGTIKKNLSLIEQLLNVGSNSQLFVAFHKMNQELEKHEMLIIEQCKTYKSIECRITTSESLRELLSLNLNNTEELAKIESNESSLNFPSYKALSRYRAEKVEIKTIQGPDDHLFYGPLYLCLLYVTNKNILLIDSRHGRCHLVDEQCEIQVTRNLSSESDDVQHMPSSATVLPSGEIAISVPEEKKIYIVDSESLTKLAHVNTKYKPRCVHGLNNGDIAVAWDEPAAFGIISSEIRISPWQIPDRIRVKEKVYVTEDKNGRSFKYFDAMAVDNWRSCVVQSSKEDSAVYCFDFEGNPKFCYKNPDLHQPNGLVIDKQGFIYVCEGEVSCIHVLNADGVLMQIIREGCPASPLAIGVDNDRRLFSVSSSGFGFAGRDITFIRIMTS